MQVPKVFDIPGALFTFMADGSKFPPIIPPEKWQFRKNGHTYEEALNHFGNVGFMAGSPLGEDLVSIGLDQDDTSVFRDLSLPPTTTWETRPGRLGMIFTCSGVPPELMEEYGKPANHSYFMLYKDGLGIGELKLERCYQVIPNSWKILKPKDGGMRVDYKMTDSRAPAYIDVSALLHSILDIPGVSLNVKGKKQNTGKLTALKSAPADTAPEYVPMEATESPVDDEEARRLSYANQALLSELNATETAPESTRYNQVYKSGCALGELIGGGLLPYDATARALVEAGEKSGLDRSECIKSARNGIEKGMKNPRKMPRPTTKADSPPPFGCPGHKPEEWFDGCYYGKPKTEEEMFIPGMSEEEFGKLKMPEGPKLTVNLPPDHFLTRMMGYGLEICDAYVEYWFLGGLFMLAVASDKKVKYELSSGTIYMNFYIYLLGLSTLARKSTVVQLVEDMLLRVLGLMFESAKVPTEFSAESFIEHMHHNNHAAWVRDEAAGVISVMKKDYMRGFKEHLMQLFDCRKISRKLRTSERKNVVKDFKVNDPFLNLLFASTDAALAQNMEPVDTQSGFIARFMFGFPRHANPNYRPLQKGTPAQSALAEVCINQLRNIAVTMSQLPECYDMVNSEEAQAYWAEWGEKRERHYASISDGYSSQIMGRMNTNALKLAMSFEVGSIDFDVTRPIRLEFMVEACRVIDTYFIPTSRAVYDIVGNQDKLNHIAHMLAYLARKGGHATKNEVMRDEKIESKKLNEYLDTMLECGQIVRQKVFNVNTKRNTEYLVLVDNQEVEKIEEISIIGKVGKVDEINTECPTLPILPTPAILPIPVILEEKSSAHGVECPVPDLPRPERERFMSDLKKHVAKNKCTCHICGHVSDHELVPDHSSRDYVNCYICTSCLISHRVKSNVQAEVLAAPSPQTSLSDVV